MFFVTTLVAIFGSVEPPGTEGRRARAWNEILAINNSSAHRIRTHEHVIVRKPGEPDYDFYDYELRLDDLGNLRFTGYYRAKGKEIGDITRVDQAFWVRDGVMFSVSPESKIAIVRAERPELAPSRCVPSVAIGLGRHVSPVDLRTVSECLSRCQDLHVESERDDRVVLAGTTLTSPMRDTRVFKVRVQIDTRTGDVLSTELHDMRWGNLFVRWEMPEWESHGTARLPASTSYQVFEAEITREQHRALNEKLRDAGLGANVMSPFDPGYARWTAFLNEVVGLPMKSRLYTTQITTITILGVNEAVGPDWFDLPPERTADITWYLSGYYEGPVDQIGAEPTEGFLGFQDGEDTPVVWGRQGEPK